MNAVYPYLVWSLAIVLVIAIIAIFYLVRQIALVYQARAEYEQNAQKASWMVARMENAYEDLAQDCHILYFALAQAWSSFRVMKEDRWHIYINLPTGLVVYVIPPEQDELFSVIDIGPEVDEEITPIKVRERLLGTAL